MSRRSAPSVSRCRPQGPTQGSPGRSGSPTAGSCLGIPLPSQTPPGTRREPRCSQSHRSPLLDCPLPRYPRAVALGRSVRLGLLKLPHLFAPPLVTTPPPRISCAKPGKSPASLCLLLLRVLSPPHLPKLFVCVLAPRWPGIGPTRCRGECLGEAEADRAERPAPAPAEPLVYPDTFLLPVCKLPHPLQEASSCSLHPFFRVLRSRVRLHSVVYKLPVTFLNLLVFPRASVISTILI